MKKVKQRSGDAFLKKMRKKTEYKIKQQEAFEEQRQAKEKHRLETEGCEIMYISTLHPDHRRQRTKVFVGAKTAIHDVVIVKCKDFYRFREGWFLVEKKFLITKDQFDKELEEKERQSGITTRRYTHPFLLTALTIASAEMYGHRKL